MKYVLVGLVLIAGLVGWRPAEPAVASRLDAIAWNEMTAAGLTTKVEISVHMDPTSSAVGLSIEQTRRSCEAGVCKDVRVISGYTRQDAGRDGAMIKSSLDRASLHTTVFFHDDVMNADVPIRVDVAWTGTGSTRCDDALGEPVCTRFATAAIELRRGGLRLVAGVTGSDDILQRQPDRALTAPPLSGPSHVH